MAPRYVGLRADALPLYCISIQYRGNGMDNNILAEASLRAAHFLGLDSPQVTHLSRHSQIDPEQVEMLLVKTYRSLHRIMDGHEAEMKLWLTTENAHLKGVPMYLVTSAGGLNDVACYLDKAYL